MITLQANTIPIGTPSEPASPETLDVSVDKGAGAKFEEVLRTCSFREVLLPVSFGTTDL